MGVIRKVVYVLGLLGSGCLLRVATQHGAGEDIEQGGRAIERATE